MSRFVRPTRLMIAASLSAIVIVVLTSIFLLARYASLPSELPVHFMANGRPNGWQYKTYTRALMPVIVQIALAGTLGSVAVLLLSRPHGSHDDGAPDVRAAAVAAETVTLLAAIWIGFQGYAAVALAHMWQTQFGALGRLYYWLEYSGIGLSGVVAVAGHVRLGRPGARPFVSEHWWFGHLYRNPLDPALFVPTRDGSRWTLNFGRPVAAVLMAVVLTIGLIGPVVILGLLLRL